MIFFFFITILWDAICFSFGIYYVFTRGRGKGKEERERGRSVLTPLALPFISQCKMKNKFLSRNLNFYDLTENNRPILFSHCSTWIYWKRYIKWQDALEKQWMHSPGNCKIASYSGDQSSYQALQSFIVDFYI